jgi:hypothetical protein
LIRKLLHVTVVIVSDERKNKIPNWTNSPKYHCLYWKMHWQHSIHSMLRNSSSFPPQKNTERDFHDNNGWASSALRFHQCREGKNRSWVISWVARVFDFVTNCWFWVFFLNFFF